MVKVADNPQSVMIQWDVPEEMSYEQLHMWLSVMIGPFADQVIEDFKQSAQDSARWENDGGAVWENEKVH